MARIRSYQKPVDVPLNKWLKLSDITGQQFYEEVFVILESPLLELTVDDLGWLRLQGIDVFSD